MVGQYWGLGQNAGQALRGVYYFKTANKIQADGMATVKGHGHAVVASDEESLGWSEDLAANTTEASTFDHCDRYFAFNASHKRALVKAFPKARDGVVVTGSARGDLLRSASYERPHPRPYILFNTSFGRTNSTWGDVNKAMDLYATALQLDRSKPETAALMKARVDYEVAALRETKALLAWFIEQKSHDIVIRPHPSERVELWREVAKGHPHVRVVAESDPYPWTKHAALMIHSDSTLGVEVTLLGTPALNISPLEDWSKRLIVRDVNFTVASAEEAYGPVEQLLKAGAGPLAAPYRTDIFPEKSAEITARELVKLLPKPTRLNQMGWAPAQRNEQERAKFTVSPQEFRQALGRVLALTGGAKIEGMDLDDSVVFLMPP